MVFKLEKIIPWGRSYKEYCDMFNLKEEECNKSFLGAGDGPAAFNVELTRRGGHVVSIDPIYRYSKSQIERRIHEIYPYMVEQVAANAEHLCLDKFGSAEKLGQARRQAMQEFLQDYETGKQQQRYIEVELPFLPFENKQFNFALCSHLLFLYSQHLTLSFHLKSIAEMCRIADIVRIFPLLDLSHKVSEHLKPVIRYLEQENYRVAIIDVAYEFQKGGNQMLQVQEPLE